MPTPSEILDEARTHHADLVKHAISAEALMLQRLALNVYHMSVELKRLDDQLSAISVAWGTKWAAKSPKKA